MTRLLDMTRLMRRAGRPMTGIDRVEFAYLRELVHRKTPLFGLVRTRLGYLLLDRSGCTNMVARFRNDDFEPADRLSRLPPDRPNALQRAEATLRAMAIARCLPQRLSKMVRAHLPRNVRYFNVGHANLTDRVISALRLHDAEICVFVHDTIPLDAPQWQRPNSVAKFRRFLARIDRHAHRVICNSSETQARLSGHLHREIPCTVAPLGIELAEVERLEPPLPPSAPYFVSLGTIEPRKNHVFLLDLWSSMGPDAPTLVIAGARGWSNEEVFARLEKCGDRVIEAPGLSDGQVRHLLECSNGLLFPSHMEGFGLPPVEAAALGVPVLSNDLPSVREVLGDNIIYEPVSDPYSWAKTIKMLAEQRDDPPEIVPPSWTDHFNSVLMLT